MSLSIDYNSITTGIINYLVANSSTLNAGLSQSVAIIDEFRAEDRILWVNQFPAISVDLINKEENIEEFGGALARRTVICEFEIGCHIQQIVNPTDEKTIYKIMRSLVKNVEDAIRDDDTLSGTVYRSDIISADFGATVVDNDQMNKTGIIRFKTTNFVTG